MTRRLTVLLAFLVSFVGLWSFAELRNGRDPRPPLATTGQPPLLYGHDLRALAGSSERVVCTAVDWQQPPQCVTWSIVMPGQRVVDVGPPPPPSECARAEVNQERRGWSCSTPSAAIPSALA